MAEKQQQTHAKRARELAVKERRERKRLRKAERANAAEEVPMDGEDNGDDNGDDSVASPELPEDESAVGSAPVEAR